MAERDNSFARSHIWKKYDLKEDAFGVQKGYIDPKFVVVRGDMIIWEKVVTPYFSTPLKLSHDFYIRKPLFEERIMWAENKANRIARKENKKKEQIIDQ